MSAHDWLAHPWALRWTEALLHFVWQGAALALLAWIILQLRSPLRRYGGLVATFALMTACPFATLAVLAWTAMPTTENDHSTASQFIAVYEIHATEFSSDLEVDDAVPADRVFAALPPTWSDWISATTSWRPAVLIVWLVGVAVFFARLIVGISGLSRLMSGTSSAPAEWSRVMRRLIDRTGRRLAVTVKVSARIAEPIAVWWWRPVILLPAAWLTEIPPGVLEAVLAHEIAHLRRWDLWINFYQRLGETLLFYHPGVWWVSRRIRIERELCCDAAAVALTGEPLGYAQALEYVVNRRQEQVRPLLAAGMGGTEMTLLSRVQRVLGLESPRNWAPGWSLGLTAAAVLIAAGAWLATASPAVVGQETEEAPASAEAEEETKESTAERQDEPRPDEPRDAAPEREADQPRERGDDFRPDRERDRVRSRGDFRPRDGERRGPPEGGPRGDFERGRGPGPREGFEDRRGPPMGPDVMRELMEQIRALREEVADLRHEVRALRGGHGEGDFGGPRYGRGADRGPRDGEAGPFWHSEGPPRDGFGPPDGARRGPPDEEFRGRRGPPEGGFRGPPDGRRGPPRDGERSPDGRRGPPDARPENLPRGDREGDRPDGPSRDEEDRPQPPVEKKEEPKKDA